MVTDSDILSLPPSAAAEFSGGRRSIHNHSAQLKIRIGLYPTPHILYSPGGLRRWVQGREALGEELHLLRNGLRLLVERRIVKRVQTVLCPTKELNSGLVGRGLVDVLHVLVLPLLRCLGHVLVELFEAFLERLDFRRRGLGPRRARNQSPP